MKVNITTAFKDFDGETLKVDLTVKDIIDVLNETFVELAKVDKGLADRLETKAKESLEEKKKPFTLKDIIRTCARNPIQALNDADRNRLFDAAVLSITRDELDLPSETIATLKKAVEEIFKAPLVVRQASLLLEGKDPFATTEKAE